MNLPNKLSLLRIFLTPLCIFFVIYNGVPLHYLWALMIFAVASFTDYLDGHIARSRNLVTNFGKLVDPLADKLLVCSVLICFIPLGYAPAIAVCLIIAREFAVSGLRLIAAEQGKVLAANKWGKAKTVTQIMSICFVLFSAEFLPSAFTAIAAPILIWVDAAITAISGVTYFTTNLSVIGKDF